MRILYSQVAPCDMSRLSPSLVLCQQDSYLSFSEFVEHLLCARPCVLQMQRQVRESPRSTGLRLECRGNCGILWSPSIATVLFVPWFSHLKNGHEVVRAKGSNMSKRLRTEPDTQKASYVCWLLSAGL